MITSLILLYFKFFLLAEKHIPKILLHVADRKRDKDVCKLQIYHRNSINQPSDVASECGSQQNELFALLINIRMIYQKYNVWKKVELRDLIFLFFLRPMLHFGESLTSIGHSKSNIERPTINIVVLLQYSYPDRTVSWAAWRQCNEQTNHIHDKRI